MKRASLPFVLAALMSASSLLFAGPALAAYNATCDNLQLNDNSWVIRDESVSDTGPWITSAKSYISLYEYQLCQKTPIIAPEASGSGAWVAIEGPFQGGAMGGNSIIQVGYWKCQGSDACNISGLVGHFDRVVYFYAFGNANDLFHQPFPQYIADASLSSTFEVFLHYLPGGTRQWEFKVDGVIKKTIDDNWRTWNRQKVQVGNEVWNEGDQQGGRPASTGDPGNKQKFRNVAWVNNTTHSGIAGGLYKTGHCYPWSAFDPTLGNAAWDTWTNNNHTDC